MIMLFSSGQQRDTLQMDDFRHTPRLARVHCPTCQGYREYTAHQGNTGYSEESGTDALDLEPKCKQRKTSHRPIISTKSHIFVPTISSQHIFHIILFNLTRLKSDIIISDRLMSHRHSVSKNFNYTVTWSWQFVINLIWGNVCPAVPALWPIKVKLHGFHHCCCKRHAINEKPHYLT